MDEDDFVPLSALQHYLYCPRQCALIHVEQQWAESRHTAEGRVLHERIDKPQMARRRDVRTVTGMPLAHQELRISGIADVVEFRTEGDTEIALPVEYKRGRPKAHRADEVQLCAQALCLETMLGQEIGTGALFYGETRRRTDVVFDEELRRLTTETIAATRAMLRAGRTPIADYVARRCDPCSLIDLCQPKLLNRRISVVVWLSQQLKEYAMRRQLNTLYVTTEGAWLHKDGANIVMDVDGETRARLPVHMLESLVCFGRVLVSPPLLGYCAEQGISACFLTPNGKFLARVEGPVSGNVLLRREQYRRSDDPARCAVIVRHILLGKIHNQRAVLGRGLRDHGDKLNHDDQAALTRAHQRLDRIADKLLQTASVELLRGLEGEAAQAYFGVFDHLIRVDDPMLRFGGRSRRPPRDAFNALLSFLYTLVTHDCRSALESVGLDPAVGFLHRDRPGRPSLALDLLEEFRPLMADRLALSLVNLRQVTQRDFQTMDNGAVLMREDARKKVLTAYQERKREELRHVFLDEKAPIGLFPFLQAQLMARHLRGDLDAYPPFLWK